MLRPCLHRAGIAYTAWDDVLNRGETALRGVTITGVVAADFVNHDLRRDAGHPWRGPAAAPQEPRPPAETIDWQKLPPEERMTKWREFEAQKMARSS